MENLVQWETEAHEGALMAQPMKPRLGVHNKNSKMIESMYSYRSRFSPTMQSITDEGMTSRPSIFAYLVFGPEGTSTKEIARPMKLAIWRSPGDKGIANRAH
jgi:hypothetical protein